MKFTDIVFIDPISGWHYHTRDCWMAGELAIQFKDLDKYKPSIGTKWIACPCTRGHIPPKFPNL